jgi:GcrA cell cycle regulator
MSVITWPAERVEQLHKLALAGKSARIAAQALGCTRGAAIGASHRHGFSFKSHHPLDYPRPRDTGWTPERVKEMRALAKQGRSANQIATVLNSTRGSVAHWAEKHGIVFDHVCVAKRTKAAPPAPIVPPPEGGITIIDLTDAVCHWPHGDPGTEGFRYCGASVSPSRVYCAHHCSLAYVPLRGRAV